MSAADREVDRSLAALPEIAGAKLRVDALVMLADAAHSALVDLGPRDALSIVCSTLLKVMGCTTAVISLHDETRRVLVSVAGVDVGGVQTRVEGRRSLASHPTLERVLDEKTPLFVRPGEGTGDAVGIPASLAAGGWLALPLLVRGTGVGVVELFAGDSEHRYTVAELALAQRVCETIAAAALEALAGAAALGAAAPASASDEPPLTEDSSGEIGRQLHDLARRLAEGVGVSHVDILVRQAPTGVLKVVARHHVGETSSLAAHVDEFGLGETGARGVAIAEERTAFARDDDSGLAPDERAEMAARGQRSAMYVPIISRDAVVGLLAAVETRTARRFTPAEEAFAQQIAWEAAVAVSSARIVEQLRVQNREFSLLLASGAAIAESVDLTATLSAIGRLLVETIGVAWCNVYDYDTEASELEVIASYQIPGVPDDPEWIGQRFGADAWADGVAVVGERESRTVYYDWAKLTPEEFAYMEPWGEKALIVVPIIYGDEVLGVLDVAESRYPRRFTEEEIRLTQAIANQAAVALRNARLYAAVHSLYQEATTRNAELETLLGAAEALSSTVDFALVLKAVCWRIREALHSTCVEVYEYDVAAQQLVYRDHASDDEYWVEDDTWTGIYEIGGNDAMQRCIRDREAVVVAVDDDETPAETRADMQRWGDSAELRIPMVYKDEVLGMISAIEVTADRRYTDDEVRLAKALANQGAVAIANARAYERIELERARLQRVNQRLRAFTELSGLVRGLVGEDELLELTGRVMSEALGFAQWVAYLYDPEAKQFLVRAAVGSPTRELDKQYRSTPIPAHVILSLLADATHISQSHFVDHRVHTWTDEEDLYLPGVVEGERGDGEWTRDDTLFVPMGGQDGDLIGYLEAYDPVDRQLPDEETVRLLEIFAARAAGAIELGRAHAELEEQSRTDGLTGLFNHGYFQERLRQEVSRASRTKRPLTVLMIDVDDFKEFNDAFGHPQGDRLLKGLAGLLVEQTRIDVDFVARYGGEEFVVVLPETALGGAELAAERLQDQLGGARTAEAVAEAIRAVTEEQAIDAVAPGRDGSVTVSVGVAIFPDHGRTPDQLVANADKALYMAKRQGKNRVRVYEP